MPEKKQIIALYSSCPRCGKTMLSEMIGEMIFKNVCQRLSFAAPMRAMVRALFKSAGMDMDKVYEKGKNAELPLYKTSIRHIMQTLGTEWGRRCINENLWCDIAEENINASPIPVVVDDLRFQNEYEMLRRHGAFIVQIVRPGYTKESEHQSNGALDHCNFDARLINDGSPQELFQQFVKAYEFWNRTGFYDGYGLLLPTDNVTETVEQIYEWNNSRLLSLARDDKSDAYRCLQKIKELAGGIAEPII